MLFTSIQWLVFLAIVFVGYHCLPTRARQWFMLGASLYFYSSWRPPFLLLIGGQLLIDWTCGYILARTDDPRQRKLVVTASVAVNLASLCVFKYLGFITRSLNAVGMAIPVTEFELPLAISFYTFESMSYTIDVYRYRIKPVRSPLHLALFITWFPHLIAGPIVRPSELIPQFKVRPPITSDRFFSGLNLMVIGYSKKLLFADWLARVADPIFARPEQFTSLELLLGVYAYAFQILLDFSAYTDIARGASRWFAIELPENFNDPYMATSITDFWRRWHMTLSHWLRDYLYIPLGGNRKGRGRTYFNLMVTMLLGGLWHGASWTFVVWGALHGLYLAVERAIRLDSPEDLGSVHRWVRRIVTFQMVCLAWVFFRSPTFVIAWSLLKGMGRGEFFISSENLFPMTAGVVLIAMYWLCHPLSDALRQFRPGPSLTWQAAYSVGLGFFLLMIMVLGAPSGTFIYFQF